MNKKIVSICVTTLMIITAYSITGYAEVNDKNIYSQFDKQEDISNNITDKIESSTNVLLDELDQNQTKDNTAHLFCGGMIKYSLTQSYIPTLPTLTKVDIKIEKKGNPTMTFFYVAVYDSLASMFQMTSIKISTSDLFSGTYWLKCDFPDITVIPGKEYYIRIYSNDGSQDSTNCFAWRAGSSNPYLRGKAYCQTFGDWEIWGNYDFCFKTYGTEVMNSPPNTPTKPSGNQSGKSGITYDYSSSAIDPDDDKVYLIFDWGDGTNSDWDGPHNSGDSVTLAHKWESDGTYTIKVKAKDTNGEESVWSHPLSVTISKNKMKHQMNILFERFIQRFPILGKILNQIL